MQKVLKICKKCGKYGGSCSPDSKIHGGNCGGELIDTGISHDELMVIRKISSDNTFLDAMIELKKNNIIEYNLKISQFRNQTNNQQQSENVPKCPTCSSTNITCISTTSKVVNVAMFGLLGQKRKHQFKCKNCGYEW